MTKMYYIQVIFFKSIMYFTREKGNVYVFFLDFERLFFKELNKYDLKNSHKTVRKAFFTFIREYPNQTVL